MSEPNTTSINAPETNDKQVAEKTPWPLSCPAILTAIGIPFFEMLLFIFLGYNDVPYSPLLSAIPGMKVSFIFASGLASLVIGLVLDSPIGDIIAIAGELVLLFSAVDMALILFGL